MAALTYGAKEAREEATRVRAEAQELKLVVRANLARSQMRLGRAQSEASRARARRVEPIPSPWSELRWTQPFETLERTLVPLP